MGDTSTSQRRSIAKHTIVNIVRHFRLPCNSTAMNRMESSIKALEEGLAGGIQFNCTQSAKFEGYIYKTLIEAYNIALDKGLVKRKQQNNYWAFELQKLIEIELEKLMGDLVYTSNNDLVYKSFGGESSIDVFDAQVHCKTYSGIDYISIKKAAWEIIIKGNRESEPIDIFTILRDSEDKYIVRDRLYSIKETLDIDESMIGYLETKKCIDLIYALIGNCQGTYIRSNKNRIVYGHGKICTRYELIKNMVDKSGRIKSIMQISGESDTSDEDILIKILGSISVYNPAEQKKVYGQDYHKIAVDYGNVGIKADKLDIATHLCEGHTLLESLAIAHIENLRYLTPDITESEINNVIINFKAEGKSEIATVPELNRDSIKAYIQSRLEHRKPEPEQWEIDSIAAKIKEKTQLDLDFTWKDIISIGK